MKTLGISYENVINIAKQNNYTISQALSLLKLNGYSAVDVNYNLLSTSDQHFSTIYQNGFTISSVVLNSCLTKELNVIYELNAIDFCLHYNLNNIIISLQDFIVNENSLSILKKNLRRIVKYANNFNVKISVLNSISKDNLYSEQMLLDLVKSVKGLMLSLDICALFSHNKTPFCSEEAFYKFVNKVYINDVKFDNEGIEYCSLFNGETSVLNNIKNFKKLDNTIDFAIFSIFESCEIEKILINSALNFLMEINYGQD